MNSMFQKSLSLSNLPDISDIGKNDEIIKNIIDQCLSLISLSNIPKNFEIDI